MFDYSSWVAHRCGAGWNVVDNDGVGSDFGICAYGDRSDDGGAGSDVYAIFDDWDAASICANYSTLAYGDIFADDGVGVDDDA